jgi:hypothetical protein
MFVRVADDDAHAGQSGNLFRRSLRVASRDHNPSVGILSPHPADGGTRILIGPSRDRAGIHYHH